MSYFRTQAVLWCAALVWLALSGCPGGSDGDDDDAEACVGAEGCACYPNDTCDEGLDCRSTLCVDLDGEGGDGDDSGGASGTGANAGGGGNGVGSPAGNGGGGDTAGAGSAGTAGAAVPLPMSECSDGGHANVTGALRTNVADVVFDSVTVSVQHKRDVDVQEDGCIRELIFEFRAGEGCVFEVVAAEEINLMGQLKIVSAQLSADSQCPMFPDESEGTYASVTPLRSGAVGMGSATIGVYNVAEACIENTFQVLPTGDLTEISSGRRLSVIDGGGLTVNGAFLATAMDGRCPIRDLPPPEPTAGTGAGAGASGAGGAGSGASGVGSPPVMEQSCVVTSLLGTGSNDTCICSPCETVGCGQGTCQGFSDCCGRWSMGDCQCVNAAAVGLSCDQVVQLLLSVGASGTIEQVPACP